MMGPKLKEKTATLKEVLKNVRKQFGEGAIMQLGSAPQGMSIPSFSTGSLGLNIALGIGGLPRPCRCCLLRLAAFRSSCRELQEGFLRPTRKGGNAACTIAAASTGPIRTT